MHCSVYTLILPEKRVGVWVGLPGAPGCRPSTSSTRRGLSLVPLSPRKQGAEGSWKPHAPGLFSSVSGTGRKQSSGPGGHGKWRPQGLVLWPKGVWGASPPPPKWSVHPPGQRHPHPSSGLVPLHGHPGTREALTPEQTPVLGPALPSHGVETLFLGWAVTPKSLGPSSVQPGSHVPIPYTTSPSCQPRLCRDGE